MISGWYIVQPKFERSFEYDMINILVGPYPSEATAVSHGPQFDAWFRSKYPGEREQLTVMRFEGYRLPEGRFNRGWGFNPAAPFSIGFNPT